jgi:hypothetical protein
MKPSACATGTWKLVCCRPSQQAGRLGDLKMRPGAALSPVADNGVFPSLSVYCTQKLKSLGYLRVFRPLISRQGFGKQKN